MKDFSQAIGGTFFYHAQERVIRDLYAEKDQLVVITNKGTIRIKPDDFKKEFLPVDTDDDRSNAIIVHHGLDADTQVMKSLSEVLMSNIAKVNANPEFIDQARAINESAKTLIDLHKTKIDMIRLVREVK